MHKATISLLKQANGKQAEICDLQNDLNNASSLEMTATFHQLSFCVTAAMYVEALVNYFFYYSLEMDVEQKGLTTVKNKVKNGFLNVDDKIDYLRVEKVSSKFIKKWKALADIRNELVHASFKTKATKDMQGSYQFFHFMPQIFCFIIEFADELVKTDRRIKTDSAILSGFVQRKNEIEQFYTKVKAPNSLPNFDDIYSKGKLQLPCIYGISPTGGFNSQENSK